MDSEHQISPHLGVGDIRFGMDREAVRERLGDPDSVDSESVPDWESWTYSARGLELTFDADESDRCTYLQVRLETYHVGGIFLLGLDLDSVERASSDLGLGEGELADPDPELESEAAAEQGEMVLEFPDADLEIHFEGGRSIMLGLSAEIDETDEFRFPQPL
ncbi:MAG: hypothetical protein AB8G23_07170 [Myxococcota bacterium]